MADGRYAPELRYEIEAVLLRDFAGWQMGSAPDDLVAIAERYIAQATDLGYLSPAIVPPEADPTTRASGRKGGSDA